MDHAKGRVAMAHFIWRDDSGRDEIVNLIETDLLRAKFFPDRIESLHAAFDEDKRHFRLVHLFFDTGGDPFQERFVLRASFFELLRQFAIVVGMKMSKREILEFAAQ